MSLHDVRLVLSVRIECKVVGSQVFITRTANKSEATAKHGQRRHHIKMRRLQRVTDGGLIQAIGVHLMVSRAKE